MIVTTDEVLSEYLTFFAGARPSIRERTGRIAAELLDNLEVHRHFEQEGFRALFRG